MKTIKDMAHEEVVALTQTELDRLVRLACAVDGVRLPGAAPEKPEAPKVERDATVYSVGSLHFSDRAAAESVSAALSAAAAHAVKLEYDWQHVGSEHKYTKAFKPDEQTTMADVSTEHALSEPNYRKVRESLIQHKALLKQYEDDLKAHEQSERATDEIRGEIMAAFNEARARQAELDRAQRVFGEYLRLADDDVEVAIKFYEKANTPSAWVRERMDLEFEKLRDIVKDSAVFGSGAERC